MSGVVCYLERSRQGALLQKVRLVAPGLDRQWLARPHGDHDAGGSDGTGREVTGADAIASAQSAAAWTVQQLRAEGRELGTIVVDAEGAICSWLSSPNDERSNILATIAQAGVSAEGASSGMSSAAVFDAGSSLGSDRSIQALRRARARGLGGSSGNGKSGTAGSKNRLAVVSIADAPVRLFLDDLDSVGMAPQRVDSLWHALARTWDPGSHEHDGRVPMQFAEGEGQRIVAESDAPLTAVVVVEPNGRLVWCWSAAGEILAAGSMRLRILARRAGDGAAPAAESPLPARADESPEIPDVLSEPVGSRVRRVNAPDERRRAEGQGVAVECGPADIGRLTADWLAWSAQLGIAPARIICLGPRLAAPAPVEVAVGEPKADLLAEPESSIAECLGRVWPGVSVDGVVDPDAVTTTLQRLASLTAAGAAPGRAQKGDHAEAGKDNMILAAPPGLTELSHRPGRVHRRLYVSCALAITGLAVAVGVLGWQLQKSTSLLAAQVEQVEDARKEVLKAFVFEIPNLDKEADPLMRLMARHAELTSQQALISHERPVLQEIVNILDKLHDFQDRMDITRLSMSSALPRLTITVGDAETGPAIRQRLNESSGIDWRDSSSPGGSADRRTWQIFGQWRTPEKADARGAAPTTAPKPADSRPPSPENASPQPDEADVKSSETQPKADGDERPAADDPGSEPEPETPGAPAPEVKPDKPMDPNPKEPT